MDLSDHQLSEIVGWAESNCGIEALWLFGSRAKGTSRAESDVDLALTLLPGLDPVDAVFDSRSGWQNELQKLTGLAVHLEVMMGDQTPHVVRYVAEAGIEIFRRA